MLSKVAKLSLVFTSLAPIFLTLWFVELSEKWNSSISFIGNIKINWNVGITFLIITISLTAICKGILILSKKKLEKIPVKIETVKTVDSEIVGFILVYLLPMINKTSNKVNTAVLVFVAILFFVIVFYSHSYHFNPLIGFLGYHFYEVNIEGGITYVLISKKNITNCRNIKKVVQITEYMILEVDEN